MITVAFEEMGATQQSQPVIDFVTYVTFPIKQPSYPECDAVLIVSLDREPDMEVGDYV